MKNQLWSLVFHMKKLNNKRSYIDCKCTTFYETRKK